MEVVETEFDPPNPWFGYLECLRDPPDCTHLLVVQDDTITCQNLTPALGEIAKAQVETPVCLFLGRTPMRTRRAALEAGARGERYVEITHGDYMPVVAVLWPVEKAAAFRDWGSSPQRLRKHNGRNVVERSDDAMGGRWMKQTRQKILATIPSLIEHPDDSPSTIAKRPANRTALFWWGSEWDALTIEWG